MHTAANVGVADEFGGAHGGETSKRSTMDVVVARGSGSDAAPSISAGMRTGKGHRLQIDCIAAHGKRGGASPGSTAGMVTSGRHPPKGTAGGSRGGEPDAGETDRAGEGVSAMARIIPYMYIYIYIGA